MSKLPVIKERTVVTAAMRLIRSVERSRLTRQQADLLVQIPITVTQSLLVAND